MGRQVHGGAFAPTWISVFSFFTDQYAESDTETPRGVQYVHCVMHKCIMVKVGRNEKHIGRKACKTYFKKSEGKFTKVGGSEQFSEIVRECIVVAKIGGNYKLRVND